MDHLLISCDYQKGSRSQGAKGSSERKKDDLGLHQDALYILWLGLRAGNIEKDVLGKLKKDIAESPDKSGLKALIKSLENKSFPDKSGLDPCPDESGLD